MNFLLVILCVTLTGSIWAQEEIYNFYSSVGKYYKFHRDPLTWYEARIACQNEGATLALPLNEEEVDVLTTYFNNTYPPRALCDVTYKDYLLLGFHDQFRENEYISLQGEAIGKSLHNYYHKWGHNQPNIREGENCGSLNRDGGLHDYPCATPGVFMCEKAEIHEEEYKCHQELGMCYKLHWNPRPWPEARAICSAESGQLAIIRNKAVEEALVKIFNNPEDLVHYVERPIYALVGFHDLFAEGHFVTVEDKDLASYGYANWAPGQPDNKGGEHCGSMTREGTINDLNCTISAVFLCEKPIEDDLKSNLGANDLK